MNRTEAGWLLSFIKRASQGGTSVSTTVSNKPPRPPSTVPPRAPMSQNVQLYSTPNGPSYTTRPDLVEQQKQLPTPPVL